jgi:PAS domain-containing protein
VKDSVLYQKLAKLRSTIEILQEQLQIYSRFRDEIDAAENSSGCTKSFESLLDSKDYLAKIFNSITDPIFVKDRMHRLILVNDAECKLAGRSREDLLGRTDYDFFP